VSTPVYPNCPGCGHNVSAVLANTCTAFVPYPEGDPRGHAGYCGCRCTDQPAIKAWIEHGRLPAADGTVSDPAGLSEGLET